MSSGFYHAIATYYDYIFPVGTEQLDFLKNTCTKAHCKILDVACGNGGYSIELSKLGHSITAVDLDATMISQAKSKLKEFNGELEMKVKQADMLLLTETLSEKYDLIFCIGNSIVHLGDIGEIRKFLCETKALLKQDGKVVFQIINFDRVFAHNITFLPTINNEKIKLSFERNYYFEPESGKVLFGTILKVDELKIENSIPLLPLLSEDFVMLMKECGYQDIEVYGDFSSKAYEKNESYMLIIKAG